MKMRFRLRKVCFEKLESRTLQSAGPLTNDGNVLKYNGTAVALRGYGDLGLVADANSGFDAALPSYHNKNFFGVLNAHGLNMVRVWISYPWAKSGSPFQKDPISGKYDLTKYDATYWSRLQTFVSDANAAGVFVQVTLSNGSELTNSTGGWNLSAYNPGNNTNVDPNGKHLIGSQSDFSSTSGPVWEQIQAPFINQTVQTLGSYPNVIYEVANEGKPHGLTEAFQEKVAKTLHQDLSSVSGSKCISVNLVSSETPGTSFRSWVMTSKQVNLVTFHVAADKSGKYDFNSGFYGNNFSSLALPAIADQDGDITQGTNVQTPNPLLANGGRLALVKKFVTATFSAQPIAGSVGIDFLDKGLNGASWPDVNAFSTGYDPLASNINISIVNVLAS